jgi:YVTN family beta-propeller protein/autotransporter-associated beta strand protein
MSFRLAPKRVDFAVRPRLRVAAAAIIIVLFAADAGHAQTGPLLYVPNSGSNNVTVIDTSSNTALASTIAVGSAPPNTIVRGDQSAAYVTNFLSNTVSVINTATNTVVGSPIGVGAFPDFGAISPNRQVLYVANRTANNLVSPASVSVINTATNTVTTSITIQSFPGQMAITNDGTKLYVANTNSNSVSVINTATNTVTATIAGLTNAFGTAVSPDGTRLYVGSAISSFGAGTASVYVVDTSTNLIVATVPVGTNPEQLAIAPDGSKVYVVNANSNTVSVISTASNTVVATITVGNSPFGAAVSPDGKTLYVTNSADKTVSIINIATNTVTGTVPTGTTPLFIGAGICSNGNGLLTSGATFIARNAATLGCTGASGPVFTGGTLQFAGANITSSVPIALQSQGGTIDTQSNNVTLSGVIGGTGSLTKIGNGILILSGTNTYSGPTNVNAGVLEVDGSIASSSLTTVSNAAVLSGIGTVGNLLINAGSSLAPGTPNTIGTLNVHGNLAFQSGAFYVASANGGTASLTNVTGTATLGGATVQVGTITNISTGHPYTILTAAGGVSGTFNANVSSNFGGSPTLSYDANDVFITFGSLPTLATFLSFGASLNQLNVANAIGSNFPLLQIQNSDLVNAATIATQVANDATKAMMEKWKILEDTQTLIFQIQQDVTFNSARLTPKERRRLQQLHLLVNGEPESIFSILFPTPPTITPPTTAAPITPPHLFSAEDPPLMPDDIARAYASVLRKAPPPAPPPDPSWNVWATGFGGTDFTRGDPIVGSHDVNARTGGVVGGATYKLAPDLSLGAALSGGGLSYALSGIAGSGRGDVFQASAYGTKQFGAAYTTAALTYGEFWNTSNRTVTAIGPDQFTSSYNTHSVGAGLEVGYHVAVPNFFTVTPFASVHAFEAWTPTFTEQTVFGDPLRAQTIQGQTESDIRTELGGHLERYFDVNDDMVMRLFGTAAWAHDRQSSNAFTAAFVGLPTASFVINGAQAPRDLAMLTAGAALRSDNGFTVKAQFDSQLARSAHTYIGSATVDYTW